MASDLPKVVHPVADAPMVVWVVRACLEAGAGRILVVVGHREELVREALTEQAPAGTVEFVVQQEQLGTGHAVQCAAPQLENFSGDVVVLAGDGPLVRPEAIRALVERRRGAGASGVLATAIVDDPTGYGRIVRDSGGAFLGVVEEKEASPEQRHIHEINPSIYCFLARDLFPALAEVRRSVASGEYYLTDVPALLSRKGQRIDAVNSLQSDEALSVNTPEQLEEVDRLLRARLVAGGRN